MKLKGGHIILGLVAILFVLMITFSPTVQSYIPPTPAWFRITSGGLNVTAQNSSGVVNFIAGTNMTITPNYATNSITFSSSGGGGPGSSNIWNIDCTPNFIQIFSNSTHPNFTCGNVPASGSTLDTMQNIGTGEASIYAGNTTNTNFTFKTFKQGQNISLANNTNDITISAAGFQNNTASNVGTDYGWFINKTGVNLFFKSIKAGPNILLANNTNDITISATDSTGITSINADATPAQVFSGTSGNITITDTGAGTLQFNTGPDIVTEAGTQALSNKSIDADSNTITNIDNGEIKAGAAIDATKIADGSVTSTEFQYINTLSSNAQTQLDTKITASSGDTLTNKIFDVAGTGNRLTSTGIVLGDLLKSDGTDFKRFAKGTAKQVLRVNTGATDLEWATYARENLVAAWYEDKTWTNIGTAYVCPYAIANDNCQSMRIDTNGMTTATLMVIWTKVGAGTQACEIVDNAGGAQLIQINNIASGINTNATQTIPAAWQNTILNGKILCKSTTAGDDPVLLQAQVLLRP